MKHDLSFERNGNNVNRIGLTELKVNQAISEIHDGDTVRVEIYNDVLEYVKTVDANWNLIESKTWIELYPHLPIK